MVDCEVKEMRKRMPKEVAEIVNLIATATGTRLFHELKRANPKVSDQALTLVVVHTMDYARKKGFRLK